MRKTRLLLGAVIVACVVLATLPVSAFSITRDQAIVRGTVWVNYKRTDPNTHKTVYGVPYSQSKYALESGAPVPTSTPTPSQAGYRTDCSGFASLCWNLRDSKGKPYSATTSIFGANKSSVFKLASITKDQLEPGDMLLASSVWGATSPHAIIFAGWADGARTQFWALEQTTTSNHDGTILRVRPYGQPYYRPFRNTMLDDAYADCEETVSQPTAAMTAAWGADAAFPATRTPSVPAVVVASSGSTADQLSGAVLAGAVGGPLLITDKASLPAVTSAEITRLKPKRIYVLGSSTRITGSVRWKLSQLVPDVQRVGNANDFDVAAAAARLAVPAVRQSGKSVDTAYVVNNKSLVDALQVAPIAAKTGRPLLYVETNYLALPTNRALRALGIRKVIVVGGTKSVSQKAVTAMSKSARAKVTRVTAKTPPRQSIAMANQAVSLGMTWDHLGLTSYTSFRDAAAAAAAQGQMGQVTLLTAGSSLDGNVRYVYTMHKAAVGKARVYGSTAVVSAKARAALAAVLRAH